MIPVAPATRGVAPPGGESSGRCGLVESQTIFVRPHVGHRGWIGLRLDVDRDWNEVREILVDRIGVV